MKIHICRVCIVLALLALLTVNVRFSTAFAQTAGNDQIFGNVVDNYGNAVAGVSVYANDGYGDVYTNNTDTNGYFTFYVDDGTWDISVDCGQLNTLGYQCVSDQSISVCCGNPYGTVFYTQLLSPPAYLFTGLYGFSSDSLSANNDGANPYGSLVLSGTHLYGTATAGGVDGDGTIFKLNTDGTSFATLHQFGLVNDGAGPNGLLLFSNALYGTAQGGGTNLSGTIFKLNTDGTGFTVLYTFSSLNMGDNIDGGWPNGQLVAFGNTLYGTTQLGGANGNGTIFAINTNGTGFNVLHTFSELDAQTGYTNSDGVTPNPSLLLSGNTLYGTAQSGGDYDDGTIFAVSTDGSSFTTLYHFTGNNDGGDPCAGLILMGNTLYGTAALDGDASAGAGNGTVFAIGTNGSGFTVLHTFTGGNDGGDPSAPLVVVNNTLYGTAVAGGTNAPPHYTGYGTVFALNTNGTGCMALHIFTDGSDGENPASALVSSGNTLYGTAPDGGPNSDGSVFAVSVTPLSVAPVLSSPRFTGGQFQMTASVTANQTYSVEMCTNLLFPNWIPLLVTNPPASSFLFADPNATNKQRFYRILEEQ